MIDTMLNYDSEYAEKHGCQKYWESIFTDRIVKAKKTVNEEDVKNAYASLKLNRDNSNTISVQFIETGSVRRKKDVCLKKEEVHVA